MAPPSGFSHGHGIFFESDSQWPASAGHKEDSRMSISLRVLAASAALAFAGSTLAAAPKTEAPPVKHRTAQQQRMADCNKRAAGKKGDERKAFMSSCLKKKAAPATH
jgi:hypothetical protein